jgi:hypothetical protein
MKRLAKVEDAKSSSKKACWLGQKKGWGSCSTGNLWITLDLLG